MKIIIFGACSGIARAVVQQYASRHADLVLVARDAKKLEAVAADARARGASSVTEKVLDLVSDLSLVETQVHQIMTESAFDVALLAHGTFQEPFTCADSSTLVIQEIQSNFLSHAVILTEIAKTFAARKQGTIACITSVAGDRGRKANYVYGSAKGGLSLFLQGLRNKLYKDNVTVLTIKPGFVDTPMTAHLKKGLLFASSEKVAADIVLAIDKKKDVLYTPFFWRYILGIINLIPECLFKRTSI